MAKELDAQISKLEAAGVKLTHADSHHHIHTGVFIAPIAARVCKAHGINKMRLHRNLGSINAVKRIVKKRYNRWLRRQGFVTTEYFAYVMDIRDAVIPANTEIMVHPDFDKDGVLIDRRGMEGGFPIGYPLPDFRHDNIKLKGYAEL
ncbi:MAG: ChbG/HpnK family deacetylase [Ruminococcus sp.]|nr:ChbG/HpnK family deacetylase [Ruminococcus sp.]